MYIYILLQLNPSLTNLQFNQLPSLTNLQFNQLPHLTNQNLFPMELFQFNEPRFNKLSCDSDQGSLNQDSTAYHGMFLHQVCY